MLENLIKSTRNFSWSKNLPESTLRVTPLAEFDRETCEHLMHHRDLLFLKGFRPTLTKKKPASFQHKPSTAARGFPRLPLVGGLARKSPPMQPAFKQDIPLIEAAAFWSLEKNTEAQRLLNFVAAQFETAPLYKIVHLWIADLGDALKDVLSAWLCGVILTRPSDMYSFCTLDTSLLQKLGGDQSLLKPALDAQGLNLWRFEATGSDLLQFAGIAPWHKEFAYLEKRLSNLSRNS